MENKFFNLIDLQLFADNDPADGDADGAGNDTPSSAPDNQPKQNPAAKYTDDDVDRILNQKFAEWQKKQEKKTSEAERLARMTTEEKAAERMRALEEKIAGYEADAARAEMTKTARAMLSDKGIHASDALLSNLIADDADATKASVESFINLFSAAIEAAVKERVKSDTPKAGGSAAGITKEQILAVTNRAERQRLMKENANLF